jgi:2-dehydro-3-deoxy-L-rhamnonate dehydrogenase (NAD+)
LSHSLPIGSWPVLSQGRQGGTMPASYDLSGRVAVVTGGSKGIGLAIAHRLRTCGAKPWIWDVAPSTVDGVPSLVVDITDGNQIDTGLSTMLKHAPGIDILVNNAVYLGDPVTVEKLTENEWQRVLDVNLTGVFKTTRRVLPHMRQSSFGRIVNMASVAGKEGFPNLAAYSCASAGIIAFTKSLGKELADTPIRVNSVAPAAVDTDMIRQFSPAAIEGMVARTALKRLGTPEEVAELVVWLCSDSCTFSTGAVFDLSGGRATY